MSKELISTIRKDFETHGDIDRLINEYAEVLDSFADILNNFIEYIKIDKMPTETPWITEEEGIITGEKLFRRVYKETVEKERKKGEIILKLKRVFNVKG